MKKILLVLAVIALSSLASAQGTFSFWNSAGTLEYCNYAVLNTPGAGIIAGYDNDTTVCGAPYNGPVVGFYASTPVSSLPVHGKGVVYGDGLYDALSGAFTGDQWTVFQKLTASKKNKFGRFVGPWCWVGVAGTYTGFYFGDNYGYCGAGYPGHNTASHGTTAGRVQ